MIRLSTGLSSAILGDYGLARMLEYGVIDLYLGEQPEYAHWAVTGTHLARITKDGLPFSRGSSTNGLTLDRSENGALRDTGDWVVTPIADGEAGWWRWTWWQPDPGETNPFYPRLDGVVNESLMLDDPVMSSVRTPFLIDSFYLTFPR